MFQRFGWVFLGKFPIGALTGLLLAAGITYVMPRQYESEAIIEIRPLSGEDLSSPDRPEGVRPEEYVSPWIVKQLAQIKSRNSFMPVMNRLDLEPHWKVDRETALGMLNQAVQVQSIRGTDVISIRVRHPDKLDAKNIAMEVANCYKEYRQEIATREEEVMLRELSKAVREQENKVVERRKVLETIVRTKGIIYQGKDSFAELPDKEAPGEAAPGSPEAPVFVDAKKDYEADQQLLQTMKLHQIKQGILLKIPEDGVLFHNEPVIADSPVSPNIPLYLTIGTVLGLLFAPLLPRPLMWVLHRLFPAKAPLTAAQP